MARLLASLPLLAVVVAACSPEAQPPRTVPAQPARAQATEACPSPLERIAALEDECRRERARVSADGELLAENARLRARVAQLESVLAIHEAGKDAAEILRLGEEVRLLNTIINGEPTEPYVLLRTKSVEPDPRLQEVLREEWTDDLRK